MLYPVYKVNYNYLKGKKWVIQKSIEAEEKWALKKEERVKEINVNSV